MKLFHKQQKFVCIENKASSKNSHPDNDLISLSSEEDEDDREEEASDTERSVVKIFFKFRGSDLKVLMGQLSYLKFLVGGFV